MTLNLEELRADFSRTMTPIYIIAAEVEQHPARLGQMLRGRLPMPLDVYQRVAEALARRRSAAG